jgi:hypothetical protein
MIAEALIRTLGILGSEWTTGNGEIHPNPLPATAERLGSPPVKASIWDFPRNSLKTLAKNIRQVCRSFPA